jgi:beta-glucanase (GH16 family)
MRDYMHYTSSLLALLLFVGLMPTPGFRAQSQSVPQAGPPPQAAGYHLVFADEFDTLNISPNRLGNYPWYNGLWWNHTVAPISNISVSNGVLNLNWNNQQGTSDTSISTASRDGQYCRAWRYGYFEARIRWDTVTGSWPAFWMIPVQNIFDTDKNSSGVKDSGEIDIMEGQGAYPHTITVRSHEWRAGGEAGPPGLAYNTNADLSQYHKYGVLWIPGHMTWYFDDQPIYSVSTRPILDQQDYFIILGSQEGVNWTYGNRTGVTASNIGMYVDWVRVWQQ